MHPKHKGKGATLSISEALPLTSSTRTVSAAVGPAVATTVEGLRKSMRGRRRGRLMGKVKTREEDKLNHRRLVAAMVIQLWGGIWKRWNGLKTASCSYGE